MECVGPAADDAFRAIRWVRSGEMTPGAAITTAWENGWMMTDAHRFVHSADTLSFR